MQETVIRAWRHADALDAGHESFRPWLLKVSKRIVIDRYRKRKAGPQEVGGETPDWLPAADETERRLSSIVVADALRSLRDVHREVLIEVYFRGRSVDEAAEALGVPARHCQIPDVLCDACAQARTACPRRHRA